jgi:hypothetical protein
MRGSSRKNASLAKLDKTHRFVLATCNGGEQGFDYFALRGLATRAAPAD